MNFIVFPVGATNIFPLANSSAGGQLLTEWSLRSRESVDTSSSVKYFIGKSFTHSQDDFKVYCQKDGYDTTISNTTIQIQPGRAIINGHYVELLTPINIDINDANTLAAKEGITPLKGKLAVGLRMAYSTYQTLAGSALTENADDYYEGVQVVILPVDAVKLPTDVPEETEFTKVNMHLLLATFNFRNGAISSVKQNEDKIKHIDAERIWNVEEMLSDTFVSKAGLDPNKIYTFAGKSADGEHIDGRDTWCDSTDSLMVWDSQPRIDVTQPSREAYFTYDSVTQQTVLVAPHKQVDGMVNTSGVNVYYQDKVISLPGADFTAGTGGVVTPQYTDRIKDISQKLDLFYRLPNGRMRQYISVLTNRDDLPAIPVSRDSKWPYSHSEYTLDISQLEGRVSQVAVDLQNLTKNINDIVEGRVSILTPAQVTTQITNIQTSLNNLGSKLANIDEWARNSFTTQTTAGDPAITIEKYGDIPYGQVETKLSQMWQTLYGDSVDPEDPGEGSLVAIVKDLDSKWQQYLDDTTADVNAAVSAVLTNMEASYTQLVNDLTAQVNSLKQYIEDRVQEALDERSVFTTWTWQPGDYVLVGEDHTVGSNINGRYPSTMYVVGPAQVMSIRYLEGQDITTVISTASGTNSPAYLEAYQTMLRTVPQSLAGGVELGSYDLVSESQASTSLWEVSAYKGAPNIDYFVARLKTTDAASQTETWKCFYYTPNLTQERFDYLDPVWVTGGIPLATEESIGGFVNVPAGYYGNGYVRLNDDGFLQLVDYELLLTGVLSYQLGQDYSEGSGLGIDEIQSILEDNVNDRVCFPNATQIENASKTGADPNIINLYLELPSSGTGTITIHDIGSRYGSCLYVHLNGSPTSGVTVVFKNCDKLRIDSNIGGVPNIILDNVCLYYDADVLDACLPTTDEPPIKNMTLWYEQFDLTDSDIQVDGMTVELLGEIESTEGIDPWDSTYANDNHYSYALRSLTFASDGSIINVGMLVGDSTTANIDEGKSVFAAEFILPQSVGLNYPVTKLTHRIKVSGSFVSQYYLLGDDAYMMKHTDFSALTQTYDPYTGQNSATGTIAFYTDAEVISHISGVSPGTTIDAWDLNTPHYFIGGVID